MCNMDTTLEEMSRVCLLVCVKDAQNFFSQNWKIGQIMAFFIDKALQKWACFEKWRFGRNWAKI